MKIKQTIHGGSKDMDGKLPVHLIPPEVSIILGQALQAGINKGYGARNWEKGLPIDEVSLAACRRHIMRWRLGEDIDGETGVHHLYLALVNLMMACVQVERGREDLDDRDVQG